MGIKSNLKKFSGSYYINIPIHIKQLLEWDEKTELDLDIPEEIIEGQKTRVLKIKGS